MTYVVLILGMVLTALFVAKALDRVEKRSARCGEQRAPDRPHWRR